MTWFDRIWSPLRSLWQILNFFNFWFFVEVLKDYVDQLKQVQYNKSIEVIGRLKSELYQPKKFRKKFSF